ncbi:MAG: ribose 5-phosphate isomerase B [Bacteroidetes bacterium]|nr:ribose 5-phosphate isomerase B [Bacteroidota bacterium]
MRLVIGSDHAGFIMKEELKVKLSEQGYKFIDVGTDNERDSVDYPDYAEAVCVAILEDRAERGILICGSGVGASVAANKISGIRAGLCHDTYSAHQGVEHDAMNVLVLGGLVIGSNVANELLEAFLKSKFTGEERHLRRLEKVNQLEVQYANRNER